MFVVRFWATEKARNAHKMLMISSAKVIKRTILVRAKQALGFPLVFGGVVVSLAIYSSCANQGMPTGGPKDSLPPVLVETSPVMRGVNFKGKEVRLTFNEYVIPDEVSEALVVSPPLSKRPTIRTKSKSLIVGFNEELKSNATYSLDFKDAVADNNERNPYRGLRFLFSTGSVIDTLRVAGVVKNAFDLEVVEKMQVMLHRNLHDSAVYRVKPDYIARSDKRGLFLFDNVAPGTYHLFALNDANSNMLYDEGAEEIAFADTLVVPSAEFVSEPDTLVKGVDSLLVLGYTRFQPDPFYLRMFTEKVFDQFLDKKLRNARHHLEFVFNEPVADTFNVRLLNREAKDWYLMEPNPEMDSIIFWVTDTLVANLDTLQLELTYNRLDSLKQLYLAKDTLHMVFTEKEKTEVRRRKKEEEKPEIPQFVFSDNIKSTGFDLNLPVLLTVPEPVQSFETEKVKLFLANDLTNTPLKISVLPDTAAWRTYRIDFKWEPNTEYLFEIDSAACVNIYGISSRKVQKKFTTQREDHYGRITLDFTSVEGDILVQLLSNSKEEKVIQTLKTDKNGPVTFDYLAPEKYRVKVIYDHNRNGKWDAGSFREKRQPERVAYLPEIVKVRSNWESQYKWDLMPDPTLHKELYDKEAEEQKLKKLQEEQRKEKEQERRQQAPMDNLGRQFNTGGGF